ncbi:amidohydrolase family protein [Herbaspirillum sp. LeCh32-8]|uniref:amidohydrolase family protein n=1 Tax=Herbaspirillum sp. LeCh32-8 TaxID=2821356 RepID=UPI001AE446BE|nr:amidohydrolase family protein [Herbaspirillum sp. LeCh32-8]MBP0598617.1 amidohydrolase family protein [Herbaspirillum sp. LeCh32-8]
MFPATQTRREFLRRSGALAAALGAGAYLPPALAQETAYPHSSGSARAAAALPADACDCHMHIYDPRFPWASGAKLLHPAATVAMYRRLQQRLGTTRNVVVTPSAYGTDNRCTLDALAQLGAAARGVAVADVNVSDEELARLDRAGVKGLRFNLALGAVTTAAMIEPLARRVAPLGWHVQINMSNDELLANRAMLSRLPTPVVFDHFARIPLQAGAVHPVYDLVAGLMREQRASVKLSGAYLASKAGAPSYADVAPLARALIDNAPGQVLWGSDWPHPTEQHKPDDALLLDLMAAWAGSEQRLRAILVDNPARLYHF